MFAFLSPFLNEPLLVAFVTIRGCAPPAIRPLMATKKLLKEAKSVEEPRKPHIEVIVFDSDYRPYIHRSILSHYNTFVKVISCNF